MKTLIATFGLTLALAGGSFAQSKPVDPSQGRDSIGQAKFAEAMKNLPEGVLEKITAAREAAKAAKSDVSAMKAQGKTPEEIKVMIAEKRTAAMANLQKALDALDGLSENAKERTAKASENISKRLDERRTVTP